MLVLCGGDLATINNNYPAIARGRGTSAGLRVAVDLNHECARRTTYSDFPSFCLWGLCFNSSTLWQIKQVTCNCKVTALFSRAHLDCRSCQWSRGGTCIYWVPRSLHAYSQADTELFGGGFKEEETDQCSALEEYLYKIRMTKHLILLLLDLAVNYLFTPHYSNTTAWCLIHIGNVFVSFSLCDSAIIIDEW